MLCSEIRRSAICEPKPSRLLIHCGYLSCLRQQLIAPARNKRGFAFQLEKRGGLIRDAEALHTDSALRCTQSRRSVLRAERMQELNPGPCHPCLSPHNSRLRLNFFSLRLAAVQSGKCRKGCHNSGQRIDCRNTPHCFGSFHHSFQPVSRDNFGLLRPGDC
jgi:hypothetical protein